MTTEWPFADRFKEFMMPPTQIREAIKRLQKKGADDIAADTEENLNVIKALHQAYARKKERARAASTKARAKAAAEEPDIGDAEVDVPCSTNEEAACEVVAEVVAEPPIVAEPPAPPTKAAKRADNVAPEAVQKKPVEAPPAPAPKRAAAAEAPARRRGGLCAMVAEVSLNA